MCARVFMSACMHACTSVMHLRGVCVCVWMLCLCACTPGYLPSDANKRTAITRAEEDQPCFHTHTRTHIYPDINSSCTGSVQTKVILSRAVLSLHLSYSLEARRSISTRSRLLCVFACACVLLYLFKFGVPLMSTVK